MNPNCDLCLSLQPSQNIMTDSSKLVQDQIIFFYDRRVFACDVTEFQAIAIVRFASRARKEGNNSSKSPDLSSISQQSIPQIVPVFSIKKSLQNFLQRRKKRAQQASPYIRTTR